MDVLLKGIILYRTQKKEEMVKRFQQVKKNPTKAVFFTCIDTRLIPAKFLQTTVGDIYTVRNAGCIVPHADYFKEGHATNEPGALELGCVLHDIKHIVVCGHSDCKAIHLLYQLRDKNFASEENRRKSPLRSWVYTHALSSLRKFQAVSDFTAPVVFKSIPPLEEIVAYIEPTLNVEDKLSQINTLQQLQNVASYEFLKERLENKDLHIHALWFHIQTGEIFCYSKTAQRFVMICEENMTGLLDEVDECLP